MNAKSKHEPNPTPGAAQPASAATGRNTPAPSAWAYCASILAAFAPANGASTKTANVAHPAPSLTTGLNRGGNWLHWARTLMTLRMDAASAPAATTPTPHTPSPADGTGRVRRALRALGKLAVRLMDPPPVRPTLTGPAKLDSYTPYQQARHRRSRR